MNYMLVIISNVIYLGESELAKQDIDLQKL